MTLSQREQTLVSVIAGLAVLFGTWAAGAALAERWRGQSRKILSRQRELAAMQAAICNRPQWLAETEQLRQGLRRQLRFEQMSDLLKQIEDIGKTAGVVISARRPLPLVEHGGYRELAVQCSFEAGIQSLVQFLFALQTETGLITVEQLQIAPRPDNISILRGDIQLRALTERSGKAAS
jgi:Tfp pilus assembly protein PilO